ncbi:M18 family aminopeptidase [Corynebacterium choanae]|nr:M18 family aminopeptidase [Corynebacterium choanae]
MTAYQADHLHVHTPAAALPNDPFVAGFGEYLHRSPTARFAAVQAAALLVEHGFTVIDETEDGGWPNSPGNYVLVRDGAVVAIVIPEGASSSSAYRIIGAHTDSPALQLKDNPTLSNNGFLQCNVEIYGGPILASWFDTDLRIAGSIITSDGEEHLVASPAVARLPHLAVHLDREKNKSFAPQVQDHMQPVLAVDGDYDNVMAYCAELAGVAVDDIVAHELFLTPAAEIGRLGIDHAMIASSRLDNLSSVYPGLLAILHAAGCDIAGFGVTTDNIGAPASRDIAILACFDHEEIGSGTRTGASGPLLQDVLTRTTHALGGNAETLASQLSRSSCISADAAHSVHPNYAQHHDARNFPVLGRGSVVKFNANHRYATDVHTTALYRRIAERIGEPVQGFVGRNNMPCGTTIGPLTSVRLGIPTVDVGVPLLSMHSTRELAHRDDLVSMTKILAAYTAGATLR